MASVAVIGAGAAGLSAARALVAAGQDVTVYEARARVGGRAWSDCELAGHAIELGAEFIHGERVATWDWVREFAARTTGAAHDYEVWFHLGRRLVDRAAARTYFGTEPITALERLAGLWNGSDRPEASLDQVLELWPQVSDRPLTPEGRALIANYVAELAASDIDQLGTGREPAQTAEEPERLRHFRLLDGYSDLMARAAAGLRILLGTPVTGLRWDVDAVELNAGGALRRFDRAIVTLPLGVLRRGMVEFSPELPAAKREAIERINAGHINKVVLLFDRVLWPPDLTFLWTPGSTQLWWRPGQGQAKEAPVLTAFFGGSAAREMEGATSGEAAEEALRQLEAILGVQLRAHLRGRRFIAWGTEPYTWMGYSSLPAHGRGLRDALAAPAGALHFAGEATNVFHPATVHGAIESGHRAAREVLAGA